LRRVGLTATVPATIRRLRRHRRNTRLTAATPLAAAAATATVSTAAATGLSARLAAAIVAHVAAAATITTTRREGRLLRRRRCGRLILRLRLGLRLLLTSTAGTAVGRGRAARFAVAIATCTAAVAPVTLFGTPVAATVTTAAPVFALLGVGSRRRRQQQRQRNRAHLFHVIHPCADRVSGLILKRRYAMTPEPLLNDPVMFRRFRAMSISPQDIVAFWSGAGPEKWFKRDDGFDALLRTRFEAAHHVAARGELAAWEETAEGALALILLLDQVPRNIYRNSPHAFAADGLARLAAERTITAGHDQATAMPLRVFFYMPFEHAEDLSLQALAVKLISAAGDAEYTRYADLHREIIVRFGRFPHRNALLGRASTEAEQRFLAEGGFSG